MRRPIFIMAGGTGGHIYPALAVARILTEQGFPILWLGTKRGLEADIVPKAGYPLVTISIGGLRGKGLFRWLLAPLAIFWALCQALFLFLRYRPLLVLGMGGFVSGPGGLASWLLHIPLLLHEQNSIAGLTNRILLPLSTIAMEGFPGGLAKYASRVRTVGNPVRADLLAISEPKIHAIKEFSSLRVLVLGGSQGSVKLNNILPSVFAEFTELSLSILHQTGKQHFDKTRLRYQKMAHLDVQVSPFINDMANAYKWADLVFCRAGALTIAELTAVGVASVLIPFPYAVDDHQTKNAHHLVKHNAAILIPELAFNETKVRALLQDFCRMPERLYEMACQARKLACPMASQDVVNACLEVANGS